MRINATTQLDADSGICSVVPRFCPEDIEWGELREDYLETHNGVTACRRDRVSTGEVVGCVWCFGHEDNVVSCGYFSIEDGIMIIGEIE